MKILIAFGLMVLSNIALGQDDVSGVLEASEGIGSIFLPMLPPGATETLAIVFASVGAVNAVSIVLEKIAEKTTTEKMIRP